MPYPYHEERARALKAFRNHELTIEHDDGVFRSLFCGQPGTSNYHFRITTWPGHLAISGDIGTFVWSRTRDMFEFFATAEDWAGMPLNINPGYWAEKLQASDTHGSGRGNSPKRSVQNETIDVAWIKREAVRRFREYYASHDFEPRRETSTGYRLRGGRMDAWDDLRRSLEAISEHDSAETVFTNIGCWRPDAVHMRLGLTGRVDTLFEYDEYENFTDWEYSFTYLMCCFAVVWTIKRYAQVKQGRDSATRSKAILRGAA